MGHFGRAKKLCTLDFCQDQQGRNGVHQSKRIYLAKGQLISKCFFGVIDFLQKTNERIRLTTMITQVDLFLFVFGGNRRPQKTLRDQLTFKEQEKKRT